MGDLFHEDVKDEWVLQVWGIMKAALFHQFIILTKRPDRMRAFVNKYENAKTGPPNPGNPIRTYSPNIQLGVSVWDQESADKFIPILLDTPAAVRVVSIEPMLGPVDLCGAYGVPWLGEERFESCESCTATPARGLPTCNGHEAGGIDGVILGGETGPGARDMPISGALAVKNQCVAAGVPFFYKGIGTAWLPKNSPYYMMMDGRTWEEMP